jgi:hypothetical protein
MVCLRHGTEDTTSVRSPGAAWAEAVYGASYLEEITQRGTHVKLDPVPVLSAEFALATAVAATDVVLPCGPGTVPPPADPHAWPTSHNHPNPRRLAIALKGDLWDCDAGRPLDPLMHPVFFTLATVYAADAAALAAAHAALELPAMVAVGRVAAAAPIRLLTSTSLIMYHAHTNLGTPVHASTPASDSDDDW